MALRAIVLVKQVPDLRAAPVGIREDGTIDRQGAPAVTNPPDLHALEAALQVAGEVVALSMGPPGAEQALREAISLSAGRGVLLCDRILAGSDTWATANALAAAIATLGSADLVVCGMTAIDGETGQVGPEVAERLGWPQATGCDDLTLDVETRHLTARRIVEGGFEILRLPLPAVVTVAETGFAPRYATFPGRRRAAAATIEQLSAADVGVDAARVGLAASPTKVARMSPAPLPERSCRFLGPELGYDALVAEIAALSGQAGSAPPAPPSSGAHEDGVSKPLPETTAFEGDPSVWVVCERAGKTLAPVSAELLSRAAELAPALGGGVGAVVCGDGGLDRVVAESAGYGADVVFVAADPALEPYRCEPYARVVADLAGQRKPAAILFGATTTGRDLAPRVASMLDTGLAADCTDLTVESWQRRGVVYERLLHQIRPAMAGGVLATCVCPEARPQMATVRPGVFAATERPRPVRTVAVEPGFTADELRVEVVERQVRHGDVGLSEADVVVAGGAGCDAESWHLVEELAAALGGKVAATRAAVEAGLAPRDCQVGQTGVTVHPRLYVACGVSGALQHAVGMGAARTILAVNRDPEAFVFHIAHFGIVGDVREVLPELTAAFRRAGRPAG